MLLLRAAVRLYTAVGIEANCFVTTSVFSTLSLHRPPASHVGPRASSVSIVTGRSGGPPQPQVPLAPGCLLRGYVPETGVRN